MDIFHSNQDEEVQKQIDKEVRMCEGANRLLAACSQREQALEAAKTLLTCNARILALLSQLQRLREAQVLRRKSLRSSEGHERLPCTGKVAISDLRIPLMWKDSEYFRNKGEFHRCAVFGLLQCGTQTYDTDLVMVDRTLTDICFEDAIMFTEVEPGFQLRVELYSSGVGEDMCCPGLLGPRRLSRLGETLGLSSGKKILAALESAAVCGHAPSEVEAGPWVDGGEMASPPASSPVPGPRYDLLAHKTLRLEHVQDGFKSHDLSITATEECPYWLPLYGNMCCRLVCQPLCMAQHIIEGQLKVKLSEDPDGWEMTYAVLRGTSLLCYQSEDDFESDELPLFKITINKDSLICASESIHITSQCPGEGINHTLAPPTPGDTQRWMEALWQHSHDMSQWRQCCDDLMKISVPTRKKSITLKQGSLYHEIGSETGNNHASPMPVMRTTNIS